MLIQVAIINHNKLHEAVLYWGDQGNNKIVIFRRIQTTKL